jgi:hypothetical protein
LGGGSNFYTYVNNNAMNFIDPYGLFLHHIHSRITGMAALAAGCSKHASRLSLLVAGVDFKQGSLAPENAYWHSMCDGTRKQSRAEGELLANNLINDGVSSCKLQRLADALHAAQDGFAGGHRGCQPWNGGWWPGTRHILQDSSPALADEAGAFQTSQTLIKQFKDNCPCICD